MVFNEKIPMQNIAIISDKGEEVTYGELLNFSLGIDKRSLVFILCKNTVESLLGYVYCLNNNIVPLLLDSQMDKDLLINLVNIYNPKYLWMPKENNYFDFKTSSEYKGYKLLKTNLSEFKLHDDLALLLTTSGSVGSPKLVRQSYNNITSNAKSIAQYLEINSNERPITNLPMNYTYALSIINSHLIKGATILLTNKTIMEKEFWDFLKEQKATSIAGVPYTYEILKKLKFLQRDIKSLKTMTQAGGKLSKELHKEFADYAEKNNKRFYVMYGATEATARMSYLPHEKSLEKCGSIGIAIPGGEFSLVDYNGEAIATPNEVGELVYRGDNVTLGYAECGEDLIKGDEFNGVLLTGDMASFDEDGYFYVVGRKKRFIKVFGNRVNLDECEQIIKNSFHVQCACTGKDDKMDIFIMDANLKNDIQKFISEKTVLNKSAFKVNMIEKIPVNESGKTDYKRLQNDWI